MFESDGSVAINRKKASQTRHKTPLPPSYIIDERNYVIMTEEILPSAFFFSFRFIIARDFRESSASGWTQLSAFYNYCRIMFLAPRGTRSSAIVDEGGGGSTRNLRVFLSASRTELAGEIPFAFSKHKARNGRLDYIPGKSL